VAQLLPAEGRGFEAPFARRDGTPGPFRSRCTQATNESRILGLPARQTHEAWLAARRRQTTQEFRAHYAARARVERTPPPAFRLRGVPRCPSIGLANAHRQQVLTAGASDRVRLSQGWAGPPPAGTRGSRFAALKPAAGKGIEFATGVLGGLGPILGAGRRLDRRVDQVVPLIGRRPGPSLRALGPHPTHRARHG
jgi:hypothetical protein